MKRMNNSNARWLAAGLAIVFAGTAFGETVRNISYTTLPGDRLVVRIELDQPPQTAPSSFTVENPARIAVDLPNTSLEAASTNQVIGVGNAQSVLAVEAGGTTRVVVNLTQLVQYELTTEGNEVRLTLQGMPANIDVEQSRTQALAAAAGRGQTSIQNVDFRRGEGGEGRVMVTLSSPGVGFTVREEGANIVVDFPNTALPERLDRVMDVLDFATPAREIDTFQFGNGTRMLVRPVGLFDHVAYSAENVFTLELQPLTPEEEEALARERFEYTGAPISLDFQRPTDIRAVLTLFAELMGMNVVVSETVTGTITMRLDQVPWDQAFDIVLETKGLGQRVEGNVVRVAPLDELHAREQAELQAQQAQRELAPLRTQFIQVNNAIASEISNLIKAEENNLLTDRGNVTVDERTNKLIVQDTAEQIEDILALVQELDIPVREVLIEARIVVANEDFSKDLGVRFGYSRRSDDGLDLNNSLNFIAGGSRPGTINYGPGTGFVDANTGNENYIVDLPVSAPAAAFQLAVGKIGSYLLQLELSALQFEGRGEVISAPRLITTNQTPALIETGTEIPYQEATSSGATNIEFAKAVLSLSVTPLITPDDRIQMDLVVNRDSVGQIFGGVPSIDTNEVTTRVTVEDGETVVLGGIYESSNREDVTRVPFFSDVPYIGNLFRRTEAERSKQELLVFVTPRIVRSSWTQP